MEMEMSVEMNETVDRLTAAAAMLEAAASRLAAFEIEASSSAFAELEEKLAVAESRIAELSARGTGVGFGRKTLLAKGVSRGEGLEGALDGALTSLSLEQRIAVKSELMRGGLLG